jgi:hypothetical protein
LAISRQPGYANGPSGHEIFIDVGRGIRFIDFGGRNARVLIVASRKLRRYLDFNDVMDLTVSLYVSPSALNGVRMSKLALSPLVQIAAGNHVIECLVNHVG